MGRFVRIGVICSLLMGLMVPSALAQKPSFWNGPWPGETVWDSCCTFSASGENVEFIRSGGVFKKESGPISVTFAIKATVHDFIEYNIFENPANVVFGEQSPLLTWIAVMCVESNTRWQYRTELASGELPSGVAVTLQSAWREGTGLWKEAVEAPLPPGLVQVVFLLTVTYGDVFPDPSSWVLNVELVQTG